MTVNALVATFAAFTIFGGNVIGEVSKSYNTLSKQGFEVSVMDVRATRYHKTDPDADKETRRGNSSLGLRLREVGLKSVGSIAVDSKVIPYGSLVIITTESGESNRFLCVDTGGDVKSRKAAKVLAKKQKLGKEMAGRPVIDIYSTKNYDEWMSVVVIKDNSLRGLEGSELKSRLKERMSVDFWPHSREIVSNALALKETNFLAER